MRADCIDGDTSVLAKTSSVQVSLNVNTEEPLSLQTHAFMQKVKFPFEMSSFVLTMSHVCKIFLEYNDL